MPEFWEQYRSSLAALDASRRALAATVPYPHSPDGPAIGGAIGRPDAPQRRRAAEDPSAEEEARPARRAA
jgi:hypothetical protein